MKCQGAFELLPLGLSTLLDSLVLVAFLVSSLAVMLTLSPPSAMPFQVKVSSAPNAGLDRAIARSTFQPPTSASPLVGGSSMGLIAVTTLPLASID